MKTIVRLDPFSDFRRLSSLLEGPRATEAPALLPLDVIETEGELVVRASIPGIRPDELQISVEENVLTLRGEHRAITHGGDAKVYRQELRYGAFTRSLRLPDTVNTEAAEATHEHGIVTVTFPYLAEVKPKSITIPLRPVTEGPTQN